MLYYVIMTIINYIGICVFATTGWLDCMLTMKDVEEHPFLVLGAALIMAWWGKGLHSLFRRD